MHVIYLLRFEWEFIFIINCDLYSVTCVGNRSLHYGKQSSYIYHDRVYYISIQLMYNTKGPSCKVVYMYQIIDVFFRLYNPFLPRPKTPFTYDVYLYKDIRTFNCPRGILGLGGASKNKLKDTSFIFLMTNITLLSIFRTHAQKEYYKVSETRGMYP